METIVFNFHSKMKEVKKMKPLKKMSGKKTRKLVQDLKHWVAKNYGKRCKDYNPFCTVCIMWDAFDTIKEGTSF